MRKIRLLVIEDNRLLREGISAMLSKTPGFNVVAALESGGNLLQNMGTHKPDVVLLEPGPGNQDGVQVVRSVMSEFPAAKVIIMDLVSTQADVFGFVRAGASGFLVKDATREDFLKTIRAVVGGTTVLPSILTGPLFAQIIRDSMNGTSVKSSRLSDSIIITRREREVILLIAEGLSNRQIAERLNLSIATVKSHVRSILEKLTLHTRVHIAQYAFNHPGFGAPVDAIPPDGE